MNGLLNPNNRLIALARDRRRPTPFLLALLLSVVVSLLAPTVGLFAIQALFFPESLYPTQEPIRAAAELVSWLVVGFGMSILFVWLWFRFFEGRSFSTLGLENRSAPGKVLRGVLLGLLIMVSIAGILAALGYANFEQEDPRIQGVAALDSVLLVAVGWAVQGSAEEIISRGWLLQTAATRYGPLVGILLSSLAFASFHLFNADITALAIVNVFLAGTFFALYALYEGSLWGVCALHATLNWAEANIFGFELYGQEMPGGVLFNLRQSGPDAFTGGGVGVGVTGGLAWTVVFVVAILVVVLLFRHREKAGKETPGGNRPDQE